MNEKTFSVVENTVGQQGIQHRILFKSVNELKEAKKAIDDGYDLYLVNEKEGVGFLLFGKDLTNQIYEGKVALGVKLSRGDQS